MKRLILASLAFAALAFLPSTAPAEPTWQGDSVGSVPAVSTSTMRTTWNCSCDNMKQEVETKAEVGDGAEATAKKHDSKVQALAKIHPPIVGPAGASAHGTHLNDGTLHTFWRTPLEGGFARTGVETAPSVTPEMTKAWHQESVIALAVEMPAL